MPAARTARLAAVFPRADRYLLGITLIWGTTFSITKMVLADFSPALLQGLRFAVASVLVGIYARHDIRTTTARSFRDGCVLGALLGLGFLLQTAGLLETTASRSGFFTGTLVVFTPFVQFAVERRLPHPANVVGVLIVAAGLFVLTSPGGGAFGRGDALVLGCAVVFAFHVVYIDVFTRSGFRADMVFYQFAVTSLIGFAAAPFFPYNLRRFDVEMFAGVLYLSVFASALALFVQNKFQRETTPTKAAIIYTMEPVFAAIFAALLLGEHLTATAGWGAAIIVTGLLVSEYFSARKSRSRASDPGAVR
jgi:drug/metabolite transporter (DMT)-like permease